MQNLRTRLRHPAVLIAILTLTGYGLLLPFTGFYWDDWPFAWIAKFQGPGEFIPAFLPFRPFLGPIFFATTSLIPPIPLYWQIFALIVRFLVGLSSWWTFSQVWPKRSSLVLSISLLMTVFPGYRQHWVAYTHINQEMIPFIFLILSFGFTFKAYQAKHPQPFAAIALLTQICGIFPTEYFFGLEGIRGLLLFSQVGGNWFKRIRETLRLWWPYLIVWLLNALWLMVYYIFGPYNSYEMTASGESTTAHLIPETLDTLWKVCLFIWIQIAFLLKSSITAPSTLVTIGLILAAILFFWFVSPKLASDSNDRSFALTLIVIGVLAIFLGRLPSLAAGLPLRLQSSYDRFMVSMMIGGSLFLLGLIELVFTDKRVRTLMLTCILALGVGQQFFNANIFRRDWEKQIEIYNELAWRIPALEPDTVLLTHQMPIDYETDLSFTAPINWMYSPVFEPASLSYAMLYTEKRLGGPTLPSLVAGTPIRFPYRTVKFEGSTSQVIVIYKPTDGCLRVLDPNRGDASVYAFLPADLTNAIHLSDPGRIIAEPETPANPPLTSRSTEPTWCYFFTRAELAYQLQDYDRVVSLESEAEELGVSPQDPNERLIFIESRARSGDVNEAQTRSREIMQGNPRMRRALCITWKRMTGDGVFLEENRIDEFINELGCPE